MFTLILETSSEIALIVLTNKDQVIASKAFPGGRELSQSLALETQKLLEGIRPELIAVGSGPGSYTGIRVGAALAKGLKMGFNADLIGFCSLKAYGPTPILIDARSGGCYALFDEEPLLVDPQDPRLLELGCIGTPHPELIKKRVPGAQVEKRFMEPEALARLVWDRVLKKETHPLKLNYVSHP